VGGSQNAHRDKAGLAGCRGLDHVRQEAMGEHERLELQSSVKQPQDPQRDLQMAPGKG
jgi:hypothetical protein